MNHRCVEELVFQPAAMFVQAFAKVAETLLGAVLAVDVPRLMAVLLLTAGIVAT
ncbi:MAG: hypothetical protein ACKVPX_01185 [Myxococcaceae bacterium]